MFKKLIKVKALEAMRVMPDTIIMVIIGAVLFAGSYKFLPAPIQAIISKMGLVSVGFVHAHITRKIAFAKVKWDNPASDPMQKLLIIALYVVIIYAYALGG